VIHPQAIIDPSAKLGRDVHVGAFSLIGPNVEIGDGTWIGPHVVLNGPTRIGRNNRIYQFASIGEAPQDLKFAGEPTRLEIGDDNVIREYCTLSRGTVGGGGITRVGNKNFLMAYVHIAHDCQVGSNTIFANCASLAGHVLVEDHARLGGFVGVHQFCRIGAHCMVGISAVVVKDVPPYMMAAGNTAKPYGLNTRGLRRHGMSTETIEALRRAYRIVYKSGLRVDEAVQQLLQMKAQFPEIGHLAEFVQQSDRGIIR
jgi:UDP-N-acetylglucosamine acyltransferase